LVERGTEETCARTATWRGVSPTALPNVLSCEGPLASNTSITYDCVRACARTHTHAHTRTHTNTHTHLSQLYCNVVRITKSLRANTKVDRHTAHTLHGCIETQSHTACILHFRFRHIFYNVAYLVWHLLQCLPLLLERYALNALIRRLLWGIIRLPCWHGQQYAGMSRLHCLEQAPAFFRLSPSASPPHPS
jgi:hypothetical protein